MGIVFTFRAGANFFTSLPPFRKRKKEERRGGENSGKEESEREQGTDSDGYIGSIFWFSMTEPWQTAGPFMRNLLLTYFRVPIWGSTGCSTVRVSTLIAHISLMSGPIIKPFDSMKVKTVRIFLVYDMSSYWLYYPILGLKMFLTSFSQMWFLCAHRPNRRIKIFYALS